MPERLTHAQADAFLAECISALGTDNSPLADDVVLDLGALAFFDSSVLAVLLGVRRAVVARGGSLRVEGMPPRLRDLATLYGVSELLPA